MCFLLHTAAAQRSNFLFWTKNFKNSCVSNSHVKTYKNRNRNLVPPDFTYTYECKEVDDISAPQTNNHL